MKRPAWSLISKERRAAVLAGTIVLQAICALFFIGDVVADFRHSQGSGGVHFSVETVAAVALLGGVVVLMVELRRLLTRMDEMDTGLRAASGQMAEVMNGFFQSWNLTGAERDVAIMILKGLDNETIAQVRNTAPGTVRAQTTSIYSKSGTQGRAQFVSLFMEELMSGDFGATDIAQGQSDPGTKSAAGDFPAR